MYFSVANELQKKVLNGVYTEYMEYILNFYLLWGWHSI